MGMLALIYGVIVYALFFAAFLYLIAFIGGDMAAFARAPKSLDWGASLWPEAPSALLNFGLLVLFGVQHTVMARGAFKRVWTRLVPWPVERSTYVLITTLLLILIYVAWIPMPAVVWNVDAPLWLGVLTALFYVGFGLVLLATFLINHFELFGLMQVWYRFQGKPMPEPQFRTPFLYKGVRHPLYLGWIIAFWATPLMTAGHLLFASVWTIYIFVALGYEERDLVKLFGQRYLDYMARVPMIVPFGLRKR
jgi:protein-S-isoprenylcysteine O-methyltransferase Ste14